jgi:hypothetical protein
MSTGVREVQPSASKYAWRAIRIIEARLGFPPKIADVGYAGQPDPTIGARAPEVFGLEFSKPPVPDTLFRRPIF